jgi:two-component system sensor histidine kinase HydH
VRLVALVLALVGGTTLAVSMLAYRRARAELVATTHARLELLGRDVGHTLQREIMNRVVDTTTWAGLETMIALRFGDVDKQIADLLSHTLGSVEDYVALAARDAAGTLVAVAGDRAVVGSTSAPVTATRVVVVTPNGSRQPLLRIDTPVMSSRGRGERIGSLSTFVDPARLVQPLVADRVRGTAVTVAILADGRPLAEVPAPVGAGEAPAMLETTLAAPALAPVGAPPMTVVVRQPVAVALASVYQLRTTLLWIGVLVVLVSGLAGAFVAWRLSDPIHQLTRSVETVAARGSPGPVGEPVRASGEVGVLAEAFDSMMQRLAVAQREVIAQSRLALLGEIAASIAHDVRTPLSVLKTSAQLLGGSDLGAAEQRDLAAMVSSEVDRLNGVVTRLVDLARPRGGTRSAQRVGALLDHVIAVLRPWAAARGVEITLFPGPDPVVDVDPDEMQQALLNLVHNAVQACGRGGRVSVGIRAADGWAIVEVDDTGPGFSDEALARAFSPFFTTKPDGTGLGLAIVRRVVEGHDGQAGAENPPDGGARVWLRLPLSPTTSSSSPR